MLHLGCRAEWFKACVEPFEVKQFNSCDIIQLCHYHCGNVCGHHGQCQASCVVYKGIT